MTDKPLPQPTPAEPRIESVPIERRCSCPPWRGHDDDPCEFCQERERARVEVGAQPEPEERAAWRKWFISEYDFHSSKLDDISWAAWRARARAGAKK